MTPSNLSDKPLSDHWDRGDAYERYIGRWSRRVAPLFLDWLAEPPGRRWLDVGCGTGALAAAIVDRCAPAAVTGVEPSPAFLASAGDRLAGRVTLLAGNADALPLADAAVDVSVAGLVLNFVDAPAALAEMARVTAPGGTIAAYVWDYAGGMALIRHFWDAAARLDPAAGGLDEGRRFPLCHPDPLAALFDAAGLDGTTVQAIEIATPFATFDDYWSPFLGGAGPAPAYTMALPDAARERLRVTLRQQLPTAADGTLDLRARAWAVRGSVGG